MSRKFDISDALLSLVPNPQWNLHGDDYSGLQWLDKNTPKPDQAELEAEVKRLQDEYDSTEYKRLRSAAYPSVEKQLEMLYDLGYDGWKAAITEIKNKYNK